MYSLIRKLIPSFLKSLFWQNYLRIKFSSENKLGKNITFSKDMIIGKKCKVGKSVSFGRSVRIADNVSIGKDVFLENIEIKNNSSVEGGVICAGYGSGRIKIGENSYIGLYNILDWSDDIVIGDYVHIAGPSTGLWTHSSALMCLNGIKLQDKSARFRPTAPIIIENNVFIGGNCTIYPGIKIGHHSIIAPNSAVTKNIEPYTMAGGVPARKIRDLSISDSGL